MLGLLCSYLSSESENHLDHFNFNRMIYLTPLRVSFNRNRTNIFKQIRNFWASPSCRHRSERWSRSSDIWFRVPWTVWMPTKCSLPFPTRCTSPVCSIMHYAIGKRITVFGGDTHSVNEINIWNCALLNCNEILNMLGWIAFNKGQVLSVHNVIKLSVRCGMSSVWHSLLNDIRNVNCLSMFRGKLKSPNSITSIFCTTCCIQKVVHQVIQQIDSSSHLYGHLMPWW